MQFNSFTITSILLAQSTDNVKHKLKVKEKYAMYSYNVKWKCMQLHLWQIQAFWLQAFDLYVGVQNKNNDSDYTCFLN